jgi:uncharacterized cupin superfamily protein
VPQGRRPIGGELGATLWGGTVYELQPGEQVAPYHWHAGTEEWLLVLDGAPTLRTPGGEQALAPWDVAVFVRGPDGAHELRNDSEAVARVLLISSVCDPEVVVYPDSGDVRVLAGWNLP